MDLKISPLDINRLQRGWECITDCKEYLLMCQKAVNENGDGLNIFMFKPPPSSEEEDKSNCDYYFTPKDSSLWNLYMESVPNEILTGYKTNTFLLCVSVPCDNMEDRCQKIGLFDIESLQPLEKTD